MFAITIYLLLSMLLVIWFDVTRFIIPNWLILSLLVLYPVMVYVSPVPVDWKMALVAAAGALVVGYILFAFKFMGAGDIKLIVVCCLWVGLKHLADFIFLMALAGGLLALIVWGLRKFLPFIPIKFTKKPRILCDKEPIPYGIAVAVGFIGVLWQGFVIALH